MAAKKKQSKSAPKSKPKSKPLAKPTRPDRPTASKKPATLVPATASTLDLSKDSTLVGAIGVAAQASLLKVTDEQSHVTAGQMLVQLKTWRQQVEEKRSFLTKPIKEHVKRIEAMFKPTLEKLEQADVAIRQKVLSYRAEAEKAKVAATVELMEKAEAAQTAGDSQLALALATEATELSTPQKTTLLDDGAVQAKKVWDFEVVEHSAIPQEYFTLDEKKIRSSIRSGVRDIPGIRVFQKDQLAVSVLIPGGEEIAVEA